MNNNKNTVTGLLVICATCLVLSAMVYVQRGTIPTELLTPVGVITAGLVGHLSNKQEKGETPDERTTDG
jgi:hypothetical protein